MKKAKIISLLLAASLLLAGCSSNDNEIPYSKSDKDTSTSDKADKNSSTDNEQSSSSDSSSQNSSYSFPQDLLNSDTITYTFTMPQLVGEKWSTVEIMYADRKLMTVLAVQEYSPDYPEGIIFEQSVAEGETTEVGTAVYVKVCSRLKQAEIKDVSGKTYETAKKLLEQDGFKTVISYRESDKVSSGLVISTEPPAHESADQGSTVVVVVSAGTPENTVSVPSFVGKTLTQALKLCEDNKLIAKLEYTYHPAEKNTIVSQSVNYGEKVPQNTEIVITVSQGEQPDIDYELEIALPTGIGGEFEFNYYVDDILQKTEVRNVSLAASRNIRYTLSGKSGETKTFSLSVKNIKTGKKGTFVECEIEFTGSSAMVSQTSHDSSVFK